MPLNREARQEYSLEPVPQYLPLGSDTQATPSGITEEPSPLQGIEAISDTPITSNREGDHHLGQSHQVNHPNSVKNHTNFNIDVETLYSPS